MVMRHTAARADPVTRLRLSKFSKEISERKLFEEAVIVKEMKASLKRPEKDGELVQF